MEQIFENFSKNGMANSEEVERELYQTLRIKLSSVKSFFK